MKINLIPPEDRHRPRPVRPESLFVVTFLILGAMLTAATVFSLQQGSMAGSRVGNLKQAVARLEPYRKQLNELRQQTRELDRQAKELEERLAQQSAGAGVAWLLQYLSAMAEHAGTVWLDRVSLTQDRLQVEGRGDSARAVAHFLSHLTGHARLRMAEGGVGLAEGETAGWVRFSVELRVLGVDGDGKASLAAR